MLRQSVKDTATRLRRWVSSLLLGEPDLGARLADLEARLGGKGLTGQITRIEQDVRALLRRQALPADTLPFPNRLTVQRFRGMSQNEEDGITLALMHEIGEPVRRFVEIGCGANGGNSGFFALECGWRGLMVDGDPERIAIARSLYEGCPVSVVQTWITREGIDDLIRMHGLDGEVDLLSIDIDGNDYWIWEAVTVCRPRAVIVEYNSLFGPELAVTIPYQEDFSRRTRSGKGYYGASLQALAYLAGRKGYRLVAIEPRGVNAYFLRNDVAPQVPACDPRQAFRGLDKLAYRNVREKAGGDVRTYFTSRGLPLVDVTSS